MGYRHIDEIDRAVLVARKAVSLAHLRRPDRLTRFLYERWYLGLPSLLPSLRSSQGEAGIPAQRSQVWQTWSKGWTDAYARAGSSLLRLHLSCAPHTSLHAIGLVSDRARSWEVPWRLTSTAMNAAVPAADATVLYLPIEALDALRSELEVLVDDLRPFLSSSVPALTLKIGRGASLAQNPADGRPFGEHRCSLVASAVVENRHLHHREQVERTLRTFNEAGIDPRRPYLERTGSWDQHWVA